MALPEPGMMLAVVTPPASAILMPGSCGLMASMARRPGCTGPVISLPSALVPTEGRPKMPMCEWVSTRPGMNTSKGLTHNRCFPRRMCRTPLSCKRQRSPCAIVIAHHVLAVANLAFQQQTPQRVFDLALDRPLQRPGTVRRIVTDLYQV